MFLVPSRPGEQSELANKLVPSRYRMASSGAERETQTRNNSMNTKTITTTVIRPVSQVREFLQFADDNSVTLKKGSAITADELAAVVKEDVLAAKGKGERACYTLRLARMLPDVTVAAIPEVLNAKGKVVAVAIPEETLSAFKYISRKLANEAATKETWLNIKYLVECADLKEENSLSCSLYTVKNALGYLKKVKAIGADGKLNIGTGGAVAKLLKKGNATGGELAPVLEKAKKARPDLFPPSEKKAKEEKKGETVKVDTADTLALDLKTWNVRFDAIVKAAKNPSEAVKAIRAACAETMKESAKLCGWDCVAIK